MRPFDGEVGERFAAQFRYAGVGIGEIDRQQAAADIFRMIEQAVLAQFSREQRPAAMGDHLQHDAGRVLLLRHRHRGNDRLLIEQHALR